MDRPNGTLDQQPSYHLPRPRLTRALQSTPVGVIVAGGGYGKSLLAAEFCRSLGVPSVTATLDAAGVTEDLLPLRLRDAARQVGLSDAAARVDHAAGHGPAAMLAALVDAFGDQPAVIVVDEVQFADPGAARMLTDFSRRMPTAHRLLLVGRELPSGMDGLQDLDDVTWLSAAELALTTDEVADICRDGFGARMGATELDAIRQTTGGWVAAVVLLAARLRAVPDHVVGLPPESAGSDAVISHLLDDMLHSLGRRQQSALIQLAHLPLIDDELATQATGIPELLATIRRAGFPMTAVSGPWFELIGPVRDRLRSRSTAKPAVLIRAATILAARGMPGTATDVLVSVGQAMAAAELLAGLTPHEAEQLDTAELTTLVDKLPPHAVAAHPRVLLHLARSHERAATTRQRAATLARTRELAEQVGDERLVREVVVEMARDLARDNGKAEAEPLASQALAATGPGEELTRARALDVLGQVASWQRDDVHLEHAQERLQMAAQAYRALGQSTWLAQVLMFLGILVETPRGRFDEALRAMDEGLALASEPRRQRGVFLTFRAELLQDLGEFDEAETNIAEALVIGERLADDRVQAYAYWDRARSASCTGDATATWTALLAVEAHTGEWFDQSGCLFLSDAADCLDRVGAVDDARRYLDRAKRHPQPDEPGLVRAESALLARNGDPDAAEACIQRMLAAPWFEPRQLWLATLLRARAAMRRGDEVAADLTATAFELCARLGRPNLPLLVERSVTETLLGLAATSPRLAALDLDPASLPVVVSMLGRFDVSHGGRPIEVPAGQGRQLLKVVAAAGGRVGVDTAIEVLWPDIDPEVGANRLRTVLNRLRESGDMVVREERTLRLAPTVSTDALRFESDARRALALGAGRRSEAVSVARSALASYLGDLLPDDPYESWTVAPRERLRRRAIALLDLCARASAETGDLDEALRCLERAMEVVPDEEERYLLAARHLLTQGRRGAARAMLARARSVIDDLGLLPPTEMLQLEEQVRRI